jgi:uncharacterized membrane protein
MSEDPEKIAQLVEKAEVLMSRQNAIQQEIADLQSEIQRIKSATVLTETSPEPAAATPEKTTIETEFVPLDQVETSVTLPSAQPLEDNPAEEDTASKPKQKSDIEKFIGENLINKIGIAITIIGVGIGAKYAIDHQLISPWTRIILGYLVGLGLFGFAFRLRKQYENFSGVLLSGSMAIMYFITFAAYSFYDLIPLVLTFILMVLFTVFTVAAAITYNRQVIAHIGLVGAYAVPFLLSDGSGKVVILFSYMTVINTGILFISFKKYWKALLYSSFLLTWLIFFSWYIPGYQVSVHFQLALVFESLFFAIFYLIFLAYKLIRKEKYEIEDILLLLANSGIFYGLGYATLYSNSASEGLTGLFTLGNGAIHFAVAAMIWLQKPADKGLLYYVTGLGLVFVTIAIPVQLDGYWVTLLWSGEAAVLFWLGRTKNMVVYEILAYPLMFVVFFSVVQDWQDYYAYDPQQPGTRVAVIFNIHFLTSLFVVLSFGVIQYLNGLKKDVSLVNWQKSFMQIMDICIPAILLIILFFAFIMEISTFWRQLYADSMVTKNQDLTLPQHFQNGNLLRYRTISVLSYSLLFLSLLSLANMKWIKNTLLGLFNLGLNAIALGVFLTLGLYALGELRESYLGQEHAEFYYRGGFNIGIRYISFVFVGLMLFSVYKYVQESFLRADFKVEFDFLLHITILTIISNELINWMDLYEPGQSYKLGLSILFGIYALLLVVLGIWKKKAHLRIAAIVLFAATLLKLFFYDLSSLDTISKTIVFVILGALLLIISFLYNKYKGLIFEDQGGKRDP